MFQVTIRVGFRRFLTFHACCMRADKWQILPLSCLVLHLNREHGRTGRHKTGNERKHRDPMPLNCAILNNHHMCYGCKHCRIKCASTLLASLNLLLTISRKICTRISLLVGRTDATLLRRKCSAKQAAASCAPIL